MKCNEREKGKYSRPKRAAGWCKAVGLVCDNSPLSSPLNLFAVGGTGASPLLEEHIVGYVLSGRFCVNQSGTAERVIRFRLLNKEAEAFFIPAKPFDLLHFYS